MTEIRSVRITRDSERLDCLMLAIAAHYRNGGHWPFIWSDNAGNDLVVEFPVDCPDDTKVQWRLIAEPSN